MNENFTDLENTKRSFKIITGWALAYAVIGCMISGFIFSHKNLIYFALGAAFSIVNFEFFKRGALMILPILATSNTQNVNPVVLILVVGKIMFVGLGVAFLILSNTFQVIPFVVGTLCILFSSLVLGVQIGLKEFIYART